MDVFKKTFGKCALDVRLKVVCLKKPYFAVKGQFLLEKKV